MKKVLVLAVLSGFILSGCSYYSCPTYASATTEVKFEESVELEENISRP